MPIIRPALRGDAKQLARLAERTFRDTFGAMNTPANMDAHCRASYGEFIQAGEILDRGMTTLLSEDEHGLAGFAQMRWNGAPECVVASSAGEIHRLYVLQGWHGKGVAQDLMTACLAAMEAHGSDVVWLGVWEKNPRAISFYRKSGFVEVGDHVFTVGDDPQRDIVMARPVRGSPHGS